MSCNQLPWSRRYCLAWSRHAHCTVQSTSDNGYTRFGTSIQVTKSGADAVDRFWKAGGNRDLIMTVTDRTVHLHKKMKKKKLLNSGTFLPDLNTLFLCYP